MDGKFPSGKYKGRWFSDVACQETSFCEWAKKQKSPAGYLRQFLAFLKTDKRGQLSMDGFVDKSVAKALAADDSGAIAGQGSPSNSTPSGGKSQQEAGEIGRRLEFTLALEVSGPEEFDVAPADAGEQLPHVIEEAIRAHPLARKTPLASRYRFHAKDYPALLRWLSFNSAFRCTVQPIPLWVLKNLKAFRASASSVQAAEKIKLSAATRRLLSDLSSSTIAKEPAAKPLAPPTRTDDARQQPDQESKKARPPPPPLMLNELGGGLLPFQRDAVSAGLGFDGRFLLGDEMGLGKTVTALALLKQYQSEWPAVIYAPAPLCIPWREHALRWLPHDLEAKDIHVVRSSADAIPEHTKLLIVSYNLASNANFQQRPGQAGDFQVVILDECHLIRGATTKRAQAVGPVAKRARRAFLLSGTPLVSRAEDAYALLDILLPDGDLPTLKEFSSRYSEARMRQRAGLQASSSCSKPARVRGPAKASKPVELHMLLKEVMVRRLKAEVEAQLPQKRRQRVTLDVPRAPQAGTKSVAADGDGNGEQQLGQLCDPKVAAVAEYIRCLLSMGAKFLVFAHHLRMLDALEKALLAEGLRADIPADEEEESQAYMRIDGRTPLVDRAAAVERFQQNDAVRVALLSLTACCQGLTLTAASLVVFAELFWVPGTLLQAEDRAHRVGQEKCVDIHYLVAPGTIDERMFQAVQLRAKDADSVVDGRGFQGRASADVRRDSGSVLQEATPRDFTVVLTFLLSFT
eukprot:TRINITY_DN24549_c0_g1_i8.p1 TRINITY_DN24549_c0_g1~~TRINITY_DN24549_c0_g1_i8.p1  ORF type:complete len:746 (-),score=127.15 TRINITY_DN24549_c0_g1_i8:59-2296(-)